MALARVAPGVRLGDMRALQDAIGGLSNIDVAASLTALAAGTQADATQLTGGINEVLTVAGANDSVQLPAAVAGTIVFVANPSAQTLTIFGKEGRADTINGTAGATGVTQATTVHGIYFCPRDTVWYRVLSA